MIEKFTFDIQAPGVKRKMILVKEESELRAHVVMKLLAYMLFYDPRLQIEAGVDMHYKPDLAIPGDHGVPELWIDCGQVTLKKAESLSGKLSRTRLIFIKETEPEMKQFRKLVEKKSDHPERVEYLSFDKGFVSGIAAVLQRTSEVTLYPVMENVIGVAINQEIFESTLHR